VTSIRLLASLLVLSLAAPCVGQEALWIEGEDASSTTFNRHGWYEDTDLRKDFMSPGEVEVSDGDWLAHYANGDVPAQATWDITVVDGGSYVWWLRCNPYRTILRYSLDGGPFVDLDLSDPRERINIVTGIDIRWLAWLRAADLTLSPGPHSITLEVLYFPSRGETQTGVDAMALVNFEWTPSGTTRPAISPPPAQPDEWFVVRPEDDPFSPDSVTDMSRLVEAPAGQGGPLRRVGAGFEFRDRPGVPVKIWGVNTGSILATEDQQRRQARLWRKNGINLVRLHPVQSTLGLLRDDGSGGRELDPVALDRLDRWFAVLKEEGILSCWSLFYPHVVTTADGIDPAIYADLPDSGAGKSTGGFVSFLPDLQDAEWAWAQGLLSHVNPYTGLVYASDPALAIIEAHNEDSIFWHWPLNPLSEGIDHPVLTAEERPRMGDFIRYLAEGQRAYYEQRRDRLRSLGFEGVYVTTAWRSGGPAAEAANLWSDDAGDAIDRHAYFGGGGGGHQVMPGNVNAGSHFDVPGDGLLGGHVYGSDGDRVPLFQVEDKPAIVSEWTMSPPNRLKGEAAPIMAFYGMGLQGWDASIHFASSRPRLGGGWPGDARAPSSYVTETPHYLGQFPALSLAVHEGHVAEGALAAARRLSLDEIFGGFDALRQDLPGGGFPATANLRTPPQVGQIGRISFKAGDGLGESERLDWAAFEPPPGGVRYSESGELCWADGALFLLTAERTQAIIGRAGAFPAAQLPAVASFVDNFAPVSLIFSSLDGNPLSSSERVLITALGRDGQVNTQYSLDGTQLLQVGGPPLLVEPVQADLEFLDGTIVSAEALDIHGVPTGVQVERSGNTIRIDGRYRTYYYEVRREFTAPACLERSGLLTLSPLDPTHATLFDPDGSGGWLLAPGAPLAAVPHVCPFGSGAADPDPVLRAGGSPLLFYNVTGALSGPIRLSKDEPGETVRVSW